MTSQKAIEYLESKAVYDELEGCNESAAAYRMAVAALRMTSQPDEQHAFFGITGVMTHEECAKLVEGMIDQYEAYDGYKTPLSEKRNNALRMAIAALRSEGQHQEHDAP